MRFSRLLPLFVVGISVGAAAQTPSAPPAPVARTYDEATLKRFEAAKPVNPVVWQGDPYAFYADKPDQLVLPKATVCALKFTDAAKSRYRLQTYADASSARADAAHVTHQGPCGTCSTLQDLVVYLRKPDLTAPVSRCGMLSAVKSLAMSCLREIGFTEACAETWYYNARNTARQCFATCMWSWLKDEPSNKPDGNLNACLECDETQSGPVFKKVAGRSRRASGIVSSIGRPNDEVYPLVHDY